MWPFNKKEVKEELNKVKENYASVTFTIENGKTEIYLDWKYEDENDEDGALDLGCLLSDINSGKYTLDIVAILEDYIKDGSAKEFAENVAMVWKESNELRLREKQLVIDEPLIHPLKVFRQSSIFRE